MISALQVSVSSIQGTCVPYFGYLTIEEGNTYALQLSNTDTWTDATNANRLKAIISSTQAIDALDYIGQKALAEQILEFPRNLDTAIPEAIKRATFLNALQILDGQDIEQEILSLNVQSDKYSQIRTTSSSPYNKRHLLAGILSYQAWVALSPYLRDPYELQLNRVS